jgi:hypothetical protein
LTLPNPEHFFEQAHRIVARSSGGPPRQVDIRRAISNAYYGVFHATMTSVADQFVGSTKRTTAQYGLVYRSVDHASLRNLCQELKSSKSTSRIARFVPPAGFGPDIQGFAKILLELQLKRNAVDYDPLPRYRLSDALLAIRAARDALSRFKTADGDEREALLALLVFKPR